ncbi:MAG: hypothetical protein QXW10_02955 [Candidatus Micrarchaeaceae archaeon]
MAGRTYKKAVFDLDGCILDDINAKLDSKLGAARGTVSDTMRELMVNMVYAMPHRKEFYLSLLDEKYIDNDIIWVMGKMQAQGTELFIVTRNKGVDPAALSSMLARHGIHIEPQNIHIGSMGKFIDSTDVDFAVSDMTDSIPKHKSDVSLKLLRRGYNTVTQHLMSMLRKDLDIKIVTPKQLVGEIN